MGKDIAIVKLTELRKRRVRAVDLANPFANEGMPLQALIERQTARPVGVVAPVSKPGLVAQFLLRLGITYDVVELAPSAAKGRILAVLEQEQEKLSLKLSRLSDQILEQKVDWAIHDERREIDDQSDFVRTTCDAPGSKVVSISSGRVGFCKTSTGRAIVRKHRGQF